jgi:hypothetical protein
MEIPKGITSCPAKDHTKYIYEKSLDITMGQEFMGSTTTSVAVDTRGAHKKSPLKFRVFEDAHVE